MLLKPHPTWLMALMLLLASPALAAEAPLADAVERMEMAAIHDLLQQDGVEVNATQVDGMTALHWAAYHDDTDLVDALIEAGADVALRNRYGVTALSLACTNANVAMVERLLEGGADPNTTLPGGETALMTAARTGKVGAVRALIAAGADLHATEEQRGQSALMWAAAEGHTDVVGVLLELGADFRAPLESGFTPLLFAVREGHLGVVRTLISAGADANATVQPPGERQRRPGFPMPRVGASALLLAVENAHYELAASLLDAGADPNAAEPGYTALHMLARVRKAGGGDNDPAPEGSGNMSSLELVRKMAAHGADLNARMTERRNLNNTRFNELGATPFMLAALVADAEYMRTLAELGADPSIRNVENSTALMAAAGLGTRSPGEDAGTEEEVIEALRVALELGANIDAVDDNGETAMHGAAYKNLPGAVELLAEHGADIEIWHQANRFGWTPMTIARGYRFGNFKPSPVTETAIERVMLARGVVPLTAAEEEAKGFDIYAPRPTTPAAAPNTPPQ